MNIDKQTFNTLDVLYDDKKWGKRIDPDEWNANFKVLEEGHNELATKLNQQVTDIDTAIQAATSGGGQNISVQYGVGTETLQDALDSVVSDINNRYTKNEVDASIGSNTNSLIANAEYNESTGAFTFTRKDGSSVVIDTVIEKVPASMALVNESDGSVSLVVTNQDGSTTKTNVTSLIEDTVINSSDTINATSVTDAVKKVTTYTLVIKPNSIGLSHIDSALTAKFEETQSAKTAAVQAKDSAVAAKTAAVAAQKSAETYASNANTYSTNASISADESADSALEAKGYAEQAASHKNSAELAKSAAIQAKNDSETAKTESQVAATETSKSESAAKQSATSASQSASSALQSATSASNSATSALQSKEAAALSEANSLANKNASAESASAAATSETNAASSALAAQTAQTAAEKARDEAQAIAGGDYVTKVELNTHTNNTTLHFTADEKTKLSGIETNANNYVHPSSHAATMITQDSTHRFVTDTEKTTWNNKASTSVVTTSANGLMISSDKSKLDGIAIGANNYVHPSSHPANIITEDSTHRFVTDAEKNVWSEKDVFIATLTSTDTDGVTTYSCDKTFDEIKAANDEGKICLLKSGNLIYILAISAYVQQVFFCMATGVVYLLKNLKNGGWSEYEYRIPIKPTSEDAGKILTVNSSGTPIWDASTQVRENLGFTYSDTAPTTTPDTGEGSVCFVLDDGSPTPIEEGGTNAVTSQEAIENLGMYPVGSVYISSTNENPATYLGGTWELVEKHFKRRFIYGPDIDGLVTNGSYCSSCVIRFILDGQTIHCAGSFSYSVDWLTTDINIATIDFTKIGCSQLRVSSNIVASSNSAAGVAYLRLGYGDGILSGYRFIPAADGVSLPSGTTINFSFDMHTGNEYMDDAFCDKFFWKRTA